MFQTPEPPRLHLVYAYILCMQGSKRLQPGLSLVFHVLAEHLSTLRFASDQAIASSSAAKDAVIEYTTKGPVNWSE